MVKRRVHAVSIRLLSTITRSAVCLRRRRPAALVIAALLLAVLSGRLWAHTSAPEQRPIPTERTVSHRTPSSHAPGFSRFPSDAEITQARVFSMPLLPIEAAATAPRHDAALSQENRALADTLLAYTQATDPDDVSALTGFLEHYPQSRWRAGLLAHLGRIYRHSGRFQHSIGAFEEAWALTKNGTDRNTHRLPTGR